MGTFEKCHRSRWWLHNWLFTRLSLFKKYKLIVKDLSKQKKLDPDLKAIQ